MKFDKMVKSDAFNRFKVISVKEDGDKKVIEIEVEHIASGEPYECHLSDSWYQSKVFPGDIMNVKSDVFNVNTYTINDGHGLVTIDPDNLISVPLVSEICKRKAWLDGFFKKPFKYFKESKTIEMMVHDVFLTAYQEGPTTFEQLKRISEECFEKNDVKRKLSNSDHEKEKLVEQVDEYLERILQALQDTGDDKKVENVKDIEDYIHSPSLGIEGKVGDICEVKNHDQTSSKKIPFIMKIGGKSPLFYSQLEDQSRLQSMLMRERGSEDCDRGRVLCLSKEEGPLMDDIKVDNADERRLLQRRNELAYYLSQKKKDFCGPDFFENEEICGKCPQRFNCSLMARCFEKDKYDKDKDKSEDFRRVFIDKTLKFFEKWMKLIKDDWSKQEKNLNLNSGAKNRLQEKLKIWVWVA